MPALIQRGSLQIGISSSGMSPSLSKRLKEDLEKMFDHEFDQFFQWVASSRLKIIKNHSFKRNRYPGIQELIQGFKVSGKIQYPKGWEKKVLPNLLKGPNH
jgi:precorrin-2 dehydrogenase/sirohydrochlorin ferrochelatase